MNSLRHESHHDYMARRLKETSTPVTKTNRELENEIETLKSRVKKLEEDMAHVLRKNGQNTYCWSQPIQKEYTQFAHYQKTTSMVR